MKVLRSLAFFVCALTAAPQQALHEEEPATLKRTSSPIRLDPAARSWLDAAAPVPRINAAVALCSFHIGLDKDSTIKIRRTSL